MNESHSNEPESIRSDINVTRQRMDDTMDALGNRLQPKHLLDEALGYLRGKSEDGESRLTRMKEKLTHSCDTAMHSVVDTVKQNPMPALMIGAGVAWMIYSNRRPDSEDYRVEDYSAADASLRYDPDTHYDQPLEYPTAPGTEAKWNDQGGSKLGQVKEKLTNKASAATDQVKEKLSHASEAAREKMYALRGRASEVTNRVKDSTRQVYARSRDRVVTTADHHPLEVGLVALAAGLMMGLAMRTPNAVNRRIGPAADRLRERTRQAGAEVLEKGKRVAQAAVSAVKEEADAQGLTPERLRQQAGAVAERAREAGKETAQREGLARGPETNPSSVSGSDPSIARPAV